MSYYTEPRLDAALDVLNSPLRIDVRRALEGMIELANELDEALDDELYGPKGDDA